MSHPNTKAAVATTAISAGLLYLANRLGYNLSQQWALLAAGALISTVLFIGRRGLRGVVRDLWAGTGSVVNGKPEE